MPQAWLPLIPSGATAINEILSVYKKENYWYYFCGIHSVFFHAENDRRSFRMFTAQLVCQGQCRQIDIIRTFGVSKNSVNRAVKKYREKGVDGFFFPQKKREGNVITKEIKAQAEELFFSGYSRSEVADKLGIKNSTLRKAINQGRISETKQQNSQTLELNLPSDKSQRSIEDAKAAEGMGTACTRSVERVFASLGVLQGAPTRFESCHDVTFGGVICALPALIANGLLSHVDECLKELKGYYTTIQILILLAYMALCRIKTTEQLQYSSPGELGKILGLDRVPEVRCLRNKLTELSKDNASEKWSNLLSKNWMEKSPELAGALYIDGHVRVYHGKKTKLPKRFVSRERLCLRGTTDYWVNDALGQPFFVVNRAVDQGMLEALRSDIVPRLLKDIPSQPTLKEIDETPWVSRFVMIFDREGYSPVFFKEMWENYRIACITYHKFPKDDWPEEWFAETEVKMPTGEILKMKLAEMGSFIGDKKDGIWVREVRKLSKNNHQTSLISTAKSDLAPQNAALIFSRWSQENFFGYMMKHFAIDLLSDYQTEKFPGKQKVVNPIWRDFDRVCRSLKAKLTNRRAIFAALELHPELDEKKVANWEKKKTKIVEDIEYLEHQLLIHKEKLSGTSKHLDWSELRDDDKFESLSPSKKRFVDTIKMIAYRAETAMTNIVREKMARPNDARSLLRDIFISEADIIPDEMAGTLTIQLHHCANPRTNLVLEHLIEQLNRSNFKYPGTNLRLIYQLGIADHPN